MTKPADLEIAYAPYNNCTGGVSANATSVNKYDGLVHEEGGKRTFSEDGCVVGGVNDSYKHTGHPLNKTKIAEDEASAETSTNSTTSANATSTTSANATGSSTPASNSSSSATPASTSNSTSGASASTSTESGSSATPATEVPTEVAAALT